VALAAGVLRAMSLTRGFAPVLALVGHGASTENNPLAAGLHCGACGGQTGEVNARALAALLNDPAVRAGLAADGIALGDTHVVAGLHDTTTDAVTLYDLDRVPASHRAAVAAFGEQLATAAAGASRARRGPRARGRPDAALDAAVRTRARDWAEVRPEWGLAGNAAFVVAPRERTRGVDLGGPRLPARVPLGAGRRVPGAGADPDRADGRDPLDQPAVLRVHRGPDPLRQREQGAAQRRRRPPRA
jgi:uncharacterized protein YbcC (UPF0753/DUF2309 family)